MGFCYSQLFFWWYCAWLHASYAQAPTSSCLYKHDTIIKEQFGVSEYSLKRHPHIPFLYRRVCAHTSLNTTKIPFSYNGYVFDAFGMSATYEQAQNTYAAFLCGSAEMVLPSAPSTWANIISFAVITNMNQCTKDSECLTNNIPTLPLIDCEWAKRISKDVCRGSPVPLRACTRTEPRLIARNACLYTSSFCRFIVLNSSVIATAAGILLCTTVIFSVHVYTKFF